ncbi:MAG: hypothetical protein ACRC1K_08500 [Planctomycetia bacterium]
MDPLTEKPTWFASMVALSAATAGAAAIIVGFCELVGPRTSAPAWQTCLLPAAAAGALVGLSQRRWTARLAAALLLLAVFNVGYGELARKATQLARAAVARDAALNRLPPRLTPDEAARLDEEVSRRLREESKTEGVAAPETPPAVVDQAPREAPPTDVGRWSWMTLAAAAFTVADVEKWSLWGALAASLYGAFQAAAFTVRDPAARPSKKPSNEASNRPTEAPRETVGGG